MRKVLRIGEKGRVKLEREEREATSDRQTKIAQRFGVYIPSQVKGYC